MASFIEEGVEEVDPNEVLTDISTSEPEAKAEEPVVQEQVEEDVPEKYRGKSAKEIAQMHMEAEKLIGRQGSEVGELRRVVDDFIKTQTTTKQQLQAEPDEEVDFFADPKRAVEKAIENHPKIREAEKLSSEMAAAKAFCGQPASANGTMLTDRFRSIDRTGEGEAASTRRPKECTKRRRNHRAVKSHRCEQDVLSQVHLISPACRSVERTSRSTPA